MSEDIQKEEKVAPSELSTTYHEKVIPELKKKYNYKSTMQVPRITKVVINIGLGRSTQNIKVIEEGEKTLETITGQKAVRCKSKLAISNFKLRAGLPIGVMTTLRGQKMWEFLDRLLNFTLPRIKDFRGVSFKAFDGRGNYTLGLKDQLVFPEINYDQVNEMFGMNVTIVTTAENDEQAYTMMEELGFPFRKRKQEKAA